MLKIMVSCGEASGDLYAGALARELRRLEPDVEIFGLGGDHLRENGGRLVGHFSGLSVTGLVEAVRVLPRSLGMYRRLVAAARAERPDVLVTIDFPDFNLRLARGIHRLGIPIVYYVSPQIWAWRRGRLETIKRLARRVLVIFPFEEGYYREAGVDASFVGHPLIELTPGPRDRDAFCREIGLEPRRPLVALLPGSRPNEVRAILPTLVESTRRIAAARPGAQFVVARAPRLPDDLFAPLASAASPLAVVESRTDDVLGAADAAVTASGTATVQAAIHECPMVIVYRLSPMSYRLGRPFVHVDTYGMVNLVAGRRIVPELIQDGFTPETVAKEVILLLTNGDRAVEMRSKLREVREKLGEPGASARAARAVLEVAEECRRQKSESGMRNAE